MTISKDLFLAILSMDAYNRGYGSGIEIAGTTIGNATITDDSSILNDPNDPSRIDEDAGFYAIAYEITGAGYADDDPSGTALTAGDTVISYRGTDFAPDPGFGDDVDHGWPMGGGSFMARRAALSVAFADRS